MKSHQNVAHKQDLKCCPIRLLSENQSLLPAPIHPSIHKIFQHSCCLSQNRQDNMSASPRYGSELSCIVCRVAQTQFPSRLRSATLKVRKDHSKEYSMRSCLVSSVSPINRLYLARLKAPLSCLIRAMPCRLQIPHRSPA